MRSPRSALTAALTTLAALAAAIALSAAPRAADGKPSKTSKASASKAYVEWLPPALAAGVTGDAATYALARVEAATRKVLARTPRLIDALPAGAPDPDTQAGAYRKFLARHGLVGAYKVSVELTAATEQVVDHPSHPGEKRLIVKVAVHLLGEHRAGHTIAFTSDGKAAIEQDLGMKLRDADRAYTWDGALEAAIDDAVQSALGKISAAK